MMMRKPWLSWIAAALGGLLLSGSGCSPSTYRGRGVVREVQAELAQVVVDHEAIVGLMPAMTMNFDVPDPGLLARLAAGQVVEFQLEIEDRHLRIVDAQVVRWVTAEDGWARLGDVLVRADSIPDFALVDQAGRPLSKRDLLGQNVLLDFIYTHCPGPCPILTGLHAAVQRALPPEVRERTRFVSISLDPARDTPAALAAYAEKRGVDLSNWSFLTGPDDAVAAVVRGFGVGATLGEDREIEHTVVSFLIDDRGRIARRYFGLETEPDAIVADLRSLVSDPALRGP